MTLLADQVSRRHRIAGRLGVTVLRRRQPWVVMAVLAAAAGGVRVAVMHAVTDQGRIMTVTADGAAGLHRADTLGARNRRGTQDAAQVGVKLMTAPTGVVFQTIGRAH